MFNIIYIFILRNIPTSYNNWLIFAQLGYGRLIHCPAEVILIAIERKKY